MNIIDSEQENCVGTLLTIVSTYVLEYPYLFLFVMIMLHKFASILYSNGLFRQIMRRKIIYIDYSTLENITVHKWTANLIYRICICNIFPRVIQSGIQITQICNDYSHPRKLKIYIDVYIIFGLLFTLKIKTSHCNSHVFWNSSYENVFILITL